MQVRGYGDIWRQITPDQFILGTYEGLTIFSLPAFVQLKKDLKIFQENLQLTDEQVNTVLDRWVMTKVLAW